MYWVPATKCKILLPLSAVQYIKMQVSKLVIKHNFFSRLQKTKMNVGF